MPEQPQEMTRRVVGRGCGIVLRLVLLTDPAQAQCQPGTLARTVTHVRDGDTIEVAGVPIRLTDWRHRRAMSRAAGRRSWRCAAWLTATRYGAN